VLIFSTLVASWLGMQSIHECGHVLGALATGGKVKQVVLNPLTISRTDVAPNPHPLPVVWAGPMLGVLIPLVLWAIPAAMRMPGAFVLRFFAGFCAIANGTYLAIGSFGRVGDCGDMLRNGSQIWQLWLFGAVTISLGLCLCHRQGSHFGLGSANGEVSPRVAYAVLLVAVLLVIFGFVVGGS
jgi:hypothetical protein